MSSASIPRTGRSQRRTRSFGGAISVVHYVITRHDGRTKIHSGLVSANSMPLVYQRRTELPEAVLGFPRDLLLLQDLLASKELRQCGKYKLALWMEMVLDNEDDAQGSAFVRSIEGRAPAPSAFTRRDQRDNECTNKFRNDKSLRRWKRPIAHNEF